jgi:hypothetical protein
VYADSALIRGFLDEIRTAAPPIIIDATATADSTAGEDLVPPLGAWVPDWRYPDPERHDWAREIWWTMTPALKGFYDLVAEDYEDYVVVDSVGPLKWPVYRRSTSVPRRP